MTFKRPFAERYVEVLLERFGHEETFEIDLSDEEGMEEVEAAFHRAGCLTMRPNKAGRLSVLVPRELRLRHYPGVGLKTIRFAA